MRPRGDYIEGGVAYFSVVILSYENTAQVGQPNEVAAVAIYSGLYGGDLLSSDTFL